MNEPMDNQATWAGSDPAGMTLAHTLTGRPGGQVVLFIHGITGSRNYFFKKSRRLAEDYGRAEEAVGKLRGAGVPEAPSGELLGDALERLGRPDDPGTYEDRGPVARGGMGEVRRVLDARLQRTRWLRQSGTFQNRDCIQPLRPDPDGKTPSSTDLYLHHCHG